jgi:hypothetical protein
MMNKAIADRLIKQATVLTDNPDERVQRLVLNPTLLIELVVRECASIADDCDKYQEYDMNGLVLEAFGIDN